MTKKKIDKKMPRLEPQFHDILVCKKNDCRPFLEVLVEEPENVSRQNLGTLVGIFQIDDRSEDSSYVVNYLISVIKKDYFSHVNRGPVENFESALHKANLALAKLATHENIGWIGRINAVCAIIEKDNLLLSQTGNASAFLLRGSTLTEITEAPNENIDSNPLKTFQDVISGKIEKSDKLIFTTKEIFDIFSLEELKKSALKFSQEDFLRFLNTALINELDQVAVLVADISEKIEEPIRVTATKKIEGTNVFSQTAFRKEAPGKMPEKENGKTGSDQKEKQGLIQELKEKASDFVDKKTGHIYIKEPEDNLAENAPAQSPIDFASWREKFSDLTIKTFEFVVRIKRTTASSLLSIREKGRKKISEIRRRNEDAAIKNLEKKIEAQIETETRAKETIFQTQTKIEPVEPAPSEIKTPLSERIRSAYAKLQIRPRMLVFLKTMNLTADWMKEKTADGIIFLLQKPTRLTIKLLATQKNKWREYRSKKTETKNRPDNDQKKYPWETTSTKTTPSETEAEKLKDGLPSKTSPIAKDDKPKKSLNFKQILPDFSRLKQIVGNFNRKQKISALAILILLLIVPYWIATWESKPEEKPAIIEETPIVPLALEQDLNVVRVKKLDEIYSGDVAKILNLNNKFFALKETEIINLESNKSFPLPSDFQAPELFFGMEDLNLLFLVKNNKLISLSPTTGKFQGNNLSFPANGKIVAAKTYLTYIYLLDTTNNQIYRAPRAEGGFGEKTLWLKDNLALSEAKDLAINENIFVINGQTISKLFRGKKQEFPIENTATPILPEKLYTKNTGTNIYVLDKSNSRIIKLSSEGKILAQYHNSAIVNITDFSVNEENDLIYLSDANGVKSFKMNQ